MLLLNSDLFASLHMFFLFRQLHFLFCNLSPCVRMDKPVIQPLTTSILNICSIFPICEMGMIKGLHAEMRILISNYRSFIQQMYLNIYHMPGIDLGAGVKTRKKKALLSVRNPNSSEEYKIPRQ